MGALEKTDSRLESLRAFRRSTIFFCLQGCRWLCGPLTLINALECCAKSAPPATAVTGVLKGYDQLLNLVLDETVEYLRGEPNKIQ